MNFTPTQVHGPFWRFICKNCNFMLDFLNYQDALAYRCSACMGAKKYD